MDNHDLISLLQQEMQNRLCDLKAEPQLVLALEKGLQHDDFIILCNSLFYREYSRDIVDVALKEDSRKRAIMELHLSRSGIYDQLPEGLFYQPRNSGTGMYSAADMATDHRANKQKEEEIRRFFLPFENDFFWQRLQLETEEGRLLEGLRSGILNDYFIQFWNIPASIPKPFIVPLIVLLPYAHKIAGDRPLMAESLQCLLKEPVRVQTIDTGITAANLPLPPLGEQQLGIDMLCGAEFMEDSPAMEFVIGPLQQSQVADYVPGGSRHELVETFLRFFVPAGVDVQITIELPEHQKNMILQPGEEPVLGYSSII
jgi:hypothetical protein